MNEESDKEPIQPPPNEPPFEKVSEPVLPPSGASGAEEGSTEAEISEKSASRWIDDGGTVADVPTPEPAESEPIESDSAPETASEPVAETPSAGRGEKRRLAWTLVGLYALSIFAAGIIWLRGGPEDGEGGLGFSSAKGFLAAATRKDAVGVIEISGPIYREQGGRLFDRGAQQIARRIRKMGEKNEVKAIVLLINSPGGSVGAVQEIHRMVQRVRRKHEKPIVAHLGDVAASGGYYVAAACDKIVSHPGTLLGSIGVIFSGMNAQGLMEKVGVKSRVIKSGKFKDIGSMSRPMTDEERELLQDMIDGTYKQFLGAVVEGRGMPESRVKPLADGRIFSGEQALKTGMIDQLGDSHDAIMLAAKLGGIQDEKPRVVRDADSLSGILEMIESRLSFGLSKETELMRSLPGFSYSGLEYRWAP